MDVVDFETERLRVWRERNPNCTPTFLGAYPNYEGVNYNWYAVSAPGGGVTHAMLGILPGKGDHLAVFSALENQHQERLELAIALGFITNLGWLHLFKSTTAWTPEYEALLDEGLSLAAEFARDRSQNLPPENQHPGYNIAAQAKSLGNGGGHVADTGPSSVVPLRAYNDAGSGVSASLPDSNPPKDDSIRASWGRFKAAAFEIVTALAGASSSRPDNGSGRKAK